MEKKEKKHLASQFPNIYRFITESKQVISVKKQWIRSLNQPKVRKTLLIASGLITMLIILSMIYGIILFSLKLAINTQSYMSLVSQREKLQSQSNFWSSVSEKYPGYKDVYFRIALLEYQLSDLEKARVYNKKALLLDPNDKNARNLQEILDKKP